MAAAVRETETYEFIRTQVTLNNKKKKKSKEKNMVNSFDG